MDKDTRNLLRNVVTQCRRILEEAVGNQLEGHFGVHRDGRVEDADRMGHLSDEDQRLRGEIVESLRHIQATMLGGGAVSKEAVQQLVREVGFTHLNRLCAFKILEHRKLTREAVGRGLNSNGFKFFLANHPDEERLWRSGNQDEAYRHFLLWLADSLSEEVRALFSPRDPANRLFPPQRVLDQLLALINGDNLRDVWSEDEAIGWIYQYYTPKELRDKARKESQAPRNSYELAFRNQFYTPRYVVQFLVDNTLGRTWYEMQRGDTALADTCQYLVRRPNEVFLALGEAEPADANDDRVYVPYRAKKDPREIRVLDPACGSGHFLLYCFDLFQTIYAEAYDDPDLGPALRRDYPDVEEYRRAVPELILRHNLHGIDIDLRATQIASLALWLRACRAYQDLDIGNDARPRIRRGNVVCAEPMPGERDLLTEFTREIQPHLLGQLAQRVFAEMRLASEAGSLLKIERAISEDIRRARQQWKGTGKEEQLLLWPEARRPKVAQLSFFDVAGISDEEFWEEADKRLLEALESYAQSASNGRAYARGLFAEDAAQGFGFVDLSRKKYDVVLMNPPFGSPSDSARANIEAQYPNSKEDIDACFVTRGVELLSDQGKLGVIANRSEMFKASLDNWRHETLLGHTGLDVVADLGHGVLDTALVETAAYCVTASADARRFGWFFRLLRDDQKADLLLSRIVSLRDSVLVPAETFVQHLSVFDEFPQSQIAYWASDSLRSAFQRFPRIEGYWGTARQGTVTSDNFRFLRLAWEVQPSGIGRSRDETLTGGKRWAYYVKGGEYSPYFQDLHLVVQWGSDGAAIRNLVSDSGRLLSRPQNLSYNFRSALTYSERTASGFSPRLCPPGCVFSHVGPVISLRGPSHLMPMLGILMSRVVAGLIELMVESGDAVTSGSAARHYSQGIVGSIPVPDISAPVLAALSELAQEIWQRFRLVDQCQETSRFFAVPCVLAEGLAASVPSLRDAVELHVRRQEDLLLEVLDASLNIEGLVRKAYGLDIAAMDELDDEFGVHPSALPMQPIVDLAAFREAYLASIDEMIDEQVEESGGSRTLTKKGYFADRRLELLSTAFGVHPTEVVQARRKAALLRDDQVQDASRDLISYAFGCCLGRWDVRFAGGNCSALLVPGPLAPPPCYSPGLLLSADAVPAVHGQIVSDEWLNARPDAVTPPLVGAVSRATIADSEYPLEITWDGILVDDEANPDDVVARVREVLALLVSMRADAIEREACELLGVRDLREYFRSPRGFWEDHVKLYSKSRRKAPIYWLLQSRKRSYGLWLYYHRLDGDIFFKALTNYVEPKIQLEEGLRRDLEARKAQIGPTGSAARQLDREIERQEALLAELGDFRDKLRRVTSLGLKPDLDDGVVLNAAPLWELMPWKVAKEYWEELLRGKYAWSSIGKQLRANGKVR